MIIYLSTFTLSLLPRVPPFARDVTTAARISFRSKSSRLICLHARPRLRCTASSTQVSVHTRAGSSPRPFLPAPPLPPFPLPPSPLSLILFQSSSPFPSFFIRGGKRGGEERAEGRAAETKERVESLPRRLTHLAGAKTHARLT